MGHKISSKIYRFLPNGRNLPHLNEECSYMFYIFFINLPEVKGKSPWRPFETYHMYWQKTYKILHYHRILGTIYYDGDWRAMCLFFLWADTYLYVLRRLANMPTCPNRQFCWWKLKFLMSVETVGLIYRRLKHILVQAPAGDTIYKEVMKKKYFYWKKGFIVVSLTVIWKFLMPILCEKFGSF